MFAPNIMLSGVSHIAETHRWVRTLHLSSPEGGCKPREMKNVSGA